MPAAAIVGAAAIGAIASSRAASKQSKAIQQATEASVEEQRRQFDLSREDLAPYRAVGVPALGRLAGIYGIEQAPSSPETGTVGPGGEPGTDPADTSGTLSPQAQQQIEYARNLLAAQGIVANTPAEVLAAAASNSGVYISPTIAEEIRQGGTLAPSGDGSQMASSQPALSFLDTGTDPILASREITDRLLSDFEESPDYRFRQEEGEGALQRQAAARGLSLSGGALKDVGRFASNLAAGEFNTFANRRIGSFDSYVNRLAALAGIGQTATNTGATIGANTAANIGNTIQQGGTNAGTAAASGYAGVANAVNSGLQNYQFQQFLNQQQPAVTGTAALAGASQPSQSMPFTAGLV